MAFHFGDLLSDQKDVRFSLPIPMVYENVRSEPIKWEYRVRTIDVRGENLLSTAELNELGNEGWLLVGVLDQGATGRSSLVQYYFVRQRQE